MAWTADWGACFFCAWSVRVRCCRASSESETALDKLEVALDGMCCMAAPFYGQYQLHSAVQRRVGGQGIVQFAAIMNTQDKVRAHWLSQAPACDTAR